MPPVEPPLDHVDVAPAPRLYLGPHHLNRLKREGWILHHRGWLPQVGDTVADVSGRHWPGVVEEIECTALFTTIRRRIVVRWPAPELPNGLVAGHHPHAVIPLASWQALVGEALAAGVLA